MIQYFDEIECTFDMATNMGGYSIDEQFNCDEMFGPSSTLESFGTNSYCAFSSSTILSIYLDTDNSSLIPDGNTPLTMLTVQTTPLLDETGSSDEATGLAYITVDENYIQDIDIIISLNGVNDNTNELILYSICENVLLSGNLSDGNNYRDWTYVEWNLPPSIITMNSNCDFDSFDFNSINLEEIDAS